MRDQTIISSYRHMEGRITLAEQRLDMFTKVLKELVGKELLRSQAVQVALIKKGVLADAEVVAALSEIIEGAKSELKSEVDQKEADELKKVEILVPDNKIVTPTGE